MEAWLFLPALALLLQGPLARLPPHARRPVEVRCGAHRLAVTVRRDLFGAGRRVLPAELALGAASCPPLRSEAAADVVVFEAALHECGSVVQMTPDFLIYQTQLFYRPSLPGHPVIARSPGTTFGLECRYPRKDNVTSRGLQPTWVPVESTASEGAGLGFSLRLMNGDWTAERVGNRFQVGEAMHLQADVRLGHHPPLRLWVESCRAGGSPLPTSGPRHDVVGAGGCLLDGREEGVSSSFLAPRLRQETLRFTVDAFRFAGEAQKQIYLTCRLKVTPATQPPDVLNKACSFDAASHSWVPVEGPRTICSCCETRSCGGAMEGQDPRGSDDGRRSLTAGMPAPEVSLALGPLFVLDPQPGGEGQSPGGPAEEEMEIEELIPAVAKGTHPPVRQEEGSSRFLEDRKDHLGLSLEALAQQGPVFFGGAEEASGFGEPTEAVTGRAPRRQQLTSLCQRAPSGHGIPDLSATGGPTHPKEAVNMAAKEGKQPSGPVPGWPLLLLPTGGAVLALLSLGVWLLARRRRRQRRGLHRAPPVSLELRQK